MTQNLDELKQTLYRAFDQAVMRSESYTNSDTIRAENAQAAAELAKAIVVVETRLDERDKDKNGVRLPGKL